MCTIFWGIWFCSVSFLKGGFKTAWLYHVGKRLRILLDQYDTFSNVIECGG